MNTKQCRGDYNPWRLVQNSCISCLVFSKERSSTRKNPAPPLLAVRRMHSKFDSRSNSLVRVTCVYSNVFHDHKMFEHFPRKLGRCFIVILWYTWQSFLKFLPEKRECGAKTLHGVAGHEP